MAKKGWTKYFDADTVTKLAHIGFKPSGLVEGNLVGNHRSPFHGFAIEFAGHRGYVPGDDIKHIDWTAYYKTEKYLLKQYEQETNFLAHILVDVSESMSFEYKHGRKIDYAAFIATALSQIIISQSDSVGLHFFADKLIHDIPTTSSMEVIAKIADFHEHAELKNATSIGDVLQLVAEQIGKRRVVFLITDFFSDMEHSFSGIKRLIDAKHEVIILQIVDPLELSFDINGRVELHELEGNEKLDFMANQIRDAYEDIFHEYLAEVKSRSMSYGVDYILCDMGRPFGFHLAEYLSKRM